MVGEKNTARMLGMSRQALNKSKKLRAGFILCTNIDGHRHFLTRSIFLFLETGDGRYLLDPISEVATDSVVSAVPETFEGNEFFLFGNPDISNPDSESFIELGDA